MGQLVTLRQLGPALALFIGLGGKAAQAAGTPTSPAALDSLRRRAAAQAADTGQAQTLNELGFRLAQLGQYAEARPVLRRAQRLSERLHFATGQVRALTGLGMSYQNEGKFAAARVVLDSAVALGQRLGEQHRLGAALLSRARLCNAQDDYACALASVQAARQFFAARGDWAHTAQALNGLGSFEGYNAAVTVDANSLAVFRTLTFSPDGTFTRDSYAASHSEVRHADDSRFTTDAASTAPRQAGHWQLDGWYLTLTDARGTTRGVAFRTDWDEKTDKTLKFRFNGTSYKATN